MSQHPPSPHPVLDFVSIRRQREFEASWTQLLQTGRHIVALIECHQWSQARQLFASRANMSRQHFAHFPIGPESREWYRYRLSELFALEQEINYLILGDQRGQADANKRPELKLVK